jgi:HSP20 family protein
MAEKRTDALTRSQAGTATQDPDRKFSRTGADIGWRAQPFGFVERFADEMDRIFDDFGLGRSRVPRFGRSWLTASGPGTDLWSPNVEIFHRNNELVVRADLPGLSKDDVTVDVTDEAITVQGERRREQEDERGGVYRSERSYGSFQRVIPLPEGAITDQAKATFRDGVLEITMPAPPDQVTRGRRLEIADTPSPKK